MLSAGRVRRHLARTAILSMTGTLVVVGLAHPATAESAQQAGTGALPTAPGLAPVAAPAATAPSALPTRSGAVKLTADGLPKTSAAAGPSLATTPDGAAAVAGAATDKVSLRALVVAVDGDDFGLPTWQATLDRVGAAYDVLHSSTTALTSTTLVNADGTGKYNAILLTNNMQLYESGGSYVSGFTTAEWNLLWDYERTYGVRQATLYSSYGTWPEDYCTRLVSEESVGDTALNVTMTTEGAQIFDYLNSTAQIPVTQSYVYRTSIALGCSADIVLTDGTNALAVRSTSTDGRERLALSFSVNQYLTHANLLVYGLFRWAAKGMFLGEQRHHLNVDVDDWFNTYDRRNADGTMAYGNVLTSAEAANLVAKQTALRSTYPLASTFAFNLAYNGGDVDGVTTGPCEADGTSVTFTATTVCLKDQLRFINHTYSHPELNTTSYAMTYAEINNSRTVATALGLPEAANVLKTPEYSGLGVYNPDPNDDINPPTDYGLASSNVNLLQASKDLNITYLHGNMSFTSHQPSYFNGSIVHPLEATISVVPDWPTNVAYHTSTPDEQTSFYNSYYGPTGLFPFWPADLTYAELMDYETTVALNQVASGSMYAHTFHIANVHDYGSGETLLTDWLNQVMTKYTSLYSVPLLGSDWSTLGAYTTARNAHAEQVTGVGAVYDRVDGTVTFTPTVTGTLQTTGLTATGSTLYGNDSQTNLALTAGTPVTVTAAPRL
ncbi:MAG: hypothetical protein HKP61_23070 [Dactylosporangium sp.]|nr:hypothetical protein [Dactylosporangium sp.]NNJ63761.1 hypothetical protein [Dactylosporangium sp.]